MDISFIDSLFHILRKQTLVHIGLRGLGRELHHHSRRRVSIHVGILTSNVIGLSVNDFLENLASLGLAREIPLVPVCNVFLCDLLARTFHQFEFYAVLNLLDTHLFGVLAVFGHIHGLENGRNDFLVVEVNETSVPFDYILDHNIRGLCYCRFTLSCRLHRSGCKAVLTKIGDLTKRYPVLKGKFSTPDSE